MKALKVIAAGLGVILAAAAIILLLLGLEIVFYGRIG